MKRLILLAVVALAFLSFGNAFAQSKEEFLAKGAAYVTAGNYDAAITAFTQAITLDPAYAEAYYNRGIAYKDKGDIGKAITDYTKAIALDPAKAQYYNNRGNAYTKLAQYDQAITDYTKAIALSSNFSEAYMNRGFVYFNQKEYIKSAQDLDKAKSLGGKSPFQVSIAAPGMQVQAANSTKTIRVIDPFSEEYKNSLTRPKGNSTAANSTQAQDNSTEEHLQALLEKQRAQEKRPGQESLTAQSNITAEDLKVWKSK